MSEARSYELNHPLPGRSRRGEAGVALLAAVLLLLMLASIGLASLNVAQRDQQVAGYLNRKAIALHAADAAIAEALQTMDATGIPSVSNTTLGDAALYPQGRPSYREDQSVADPIESVGTGNLEGMGLGIGANASAQFQVQYWKVRVQGEAPGGSLARVEMLTGALVGN
jgi:hypothetical protein